ncbi:Ubiquitin system component Cue protein [Euphorbia peplus]|nr:Ubiquitin system component Cue protein [Euphorbia peplus]
MSRRQNNNTRSSSQEWSSSNNNNRNISQKFVPKNQNPTLSNSLRQSDDVAPSSSSSTSVVAASSSKGESVSNRSRASSAQVGGNFVNYLPQDEAVAAGLGEGGLDPVESQRVVDLLNKELSRLLKLTPKLFWREVATDNSLHEFLDSFLKFRSRWYDFPHRGAKAIVAGVVVGELELSRRVFMVLYRISSNKDQGARPSDTLSSRDHTVLLQEKKLLDLPKLLDICAIYGHENEELTRFLVVNALQAQPWIHDNFTSILSRFLGIIHTMYQRCTSSLEVLFSSGSHEDLGFSSRHYDFLEVLDFINDAIVSMDAFVNAYEQAAVFFLCPVEMSHGNEELIIILAKLHDTLLPSLNRGFRIILAGTDDELMTKIAVSLKMLSSRIIKFGWKLFEVCYLSNEVFSDSLSIPATKMFPANIEDPSIRADILIQTLREISGVLLYSQENQKRETFLQNFDKNYYLMSRLQSLQDAGWIFMDNEQLQYITGIIKSSVDGTVQKHMPIPLPSNKVGIDEDAAIKDSKISQIKDIFTDYGKGFLSACLEAYNQDPEEVIQRILEGTLHEDLKCLDTSLETMPTPKSASAISSKDKGKGKLIDSAPLSSPPLIRDINPMATEVQQREKPSVSSSSSTGRFVRKSNEVLENYTTGTKDAKNAAKIAALASQYEYDDEYDDSFDDLGLSVAESGIEENEILSSNFGRSSGTETESSAPPSASSKWGSRKKPQYYVKDGKNYSYKVAGSVAVANYNEAVVINEAQGELIFGLGRGGNIPRGAAKKLAEYQEKEHEKVESDEPEAVGRGTPMNARGWGRGQGRRGGRVNEPSQEENDNEVEGGGNVGNYRGRGRRGGGRSSNNFRKDRAMKKHLSGLSGF